MNKELINKTIAHNIMLRLEQSQLHKNNLAQIAGITKGQARAALSGNGASSYVLYRLAHIFNCAADDFFLGIFDKRNAKRSGRNANGSQLRFFNSLHNHELIRQLASINNPELQGYIYSLLTGLAGIFRFLEMEGLQLQKHEQ